MTFSGTSCYINGIGCVSAQKTFDNEGTLFDELTTRQANVLPVESPDYTAYISRGASRRMALGVKMGTVASAIALREADIADPDAILTGSGMGCLIDSEKFLEKILDNDEEYLTPTPFIQSTHNTVGAQIALGLKCQSYNMTYVHGALSFESALMDALLFFGESPHKKQNILVGGVDEWAPHTLKLYRLIRHIKEEEPDTMALLQTKTRGTIFGQGAQFFMLSNRQQEGSYARIRATDMASRLVAQNPEERLERFLSNNNLTIPDIDLVVLGNNGDIEYDGFYHKIQSSLFANTQQVYYKHLCGEYNTASAFGCWMAARILKEQQVPDVVRLNDVFDPDAAIKRILLYNQYRGEYHGWMLMEKV